MSRLLAASTQRCAARTVQASWLALLILTVAWEAWIAPLRPGGTWMVLKALPLMVLAPRVMRLEPRALQWGVLIVPFYLAEGAVRVIEPLPFRACALLEILASSVFFAAAVVALRPYKHAARPRREEEDR